MSAIDSMAGLRPGDIMFGPIGGLAGAGVGAGQLILGEGFRLGRLSIRHVGIVVEASAELPPGTMRNLVTGEWHSGGLHARDMAFGQEYETYDTGVLAAPRLVQAMPGGAEEVEMRQQTHWTDRHAYVRLPEDYPGQAANAAAIARGMVAEGVAYSPASYLALALWRFGVKTPRLERWIGRRESGAETVLPSGRTLRLAFPCEAICSVLADQAWSLAGKRVVTGTVPQVVTPGMMAGQLWSRSLRPESGIVWGGPAVQR